MSSEEETKATLPTLAPDSLPAFLSVHHISSDKNPFVSKMGQEVQGPDSENATASPGSLAPFAAELLSTKNPFTPERDRAPATLGPKGIPHFPSSHHLAASVPKAPFSRQVSGNNPFASELGQSSWGRGPESSDTWASKGLSRPPPPSLPSDCHFNGNNPFLPKPGWEADAPGLKAVMSSSPFCLPCDGDCSSAEPAKPQDSARDPAGSASGVALPSDVKAASQPLSPSLDSRGLAPKQQCESPQCRVETSSKRSQPGNRLSVSILLGGPEGVTSGDEGLGGWECEKQHPDFSRTWMGSDAAGERAGFAQDLDTGTSPMSEHCSDSAGPLRNSLLPGMGAEQPPSPESQLREKQEIFGGKRQEENVPTAEPQAAPLDESNLFSQAGSAEAPLGARTLSPRDTAVRRAGKDAPVAPKPVPRLSVTLKKSSLVTQADKLSGDVSSSGDGVKSAPGPPLLHGKGSDARRCLPQNGSLETFTPTVALGDDSSDRHVKNKGDDDIFDCLTNLKSAIPLTGDRGLKLAGLPVIPEGGSDDELLGDCQENCAVAAGDKNVPEAGNQSLDLMPLPEELRESSGSSAAAHGTLAALGGGGGGGSAPGTHEPSKGPVLPARVAVSRASSQVADSGFTTTPRSGECSSYFEKPELTVSTGIEEQAECDFSESSVSSSSLSSPSQPCSSSHSLPSDAPSRRAESPKKPTAEGSADKAGNSGKKKLLQAWVSPSETYPNLAQQSGETMSPKHR